MTIIIVGIEVKGLFREIAVAIDKSFGDITKSDIDEMELPGVTGWMRWESCKEGYDEEELGWYLTIKSQNLKMKNEIRTLYEKTLIQKGVIMCNEECIANQRASIEVLSLNIARQKMIAEIREEAYAADQRENDRSIGTSKNKIIDMLSAATHIDRQKMIVKIREEDIEEELSEYIDFIDGLYNAIADIAEIVHVWKDHTMSSDRIAMNKIAHAVEDYLEIEV